ncbi:calcium-binding protein [Methylovulum psychrotolerans]|uniref:Haemolysin-type calcium binding-related domain-containing protein n=1 Tax=Methylovulum psychrotolerans TaxID=1704499 RepID=A0A1Z4C1T2_9GAMM|nr:calcium-binding protein [Methylovulum psychrotolerans]ASF47460.1 hypothetical protein CEK71_16100 [Methylovulum psychrotolerans]
MATYNGDNNNNFYGGTAGDDFIYGNGGSDNLYGNGGNDTISGGTGNDYINGGAGDDTYLVAKGDGYDVIVDDIGTNIIKFSDVASTDVSQVGRSTYLGLDLLLTYGSNRVTVGNYFLGANYNIQLQFSNSVTWNWADIKALASVAPTAGNDTLYGTYNNDTLSGLDGNDSLSGYTGDDTLNGGAGDDILDGGIGNDILNGGTGNDSLKGSAGSDTYLIAKNDGQDIIVELNGADTVNFTDVASTDITQVKRGGFGTDLVLTYGNGGQLTVRYYFGTDYASGTTTIEKFHFSDGVNWGWASIAPKVSQGTAGNDTLTGYDDRSDALSGGAGNDTLTGLAGNDLLNGGIGNDVLNGGLGNDVYQIAKNDGSDIINDEGGVDSIKFTDVASTDITQVSRLASNYGLGMDLLVKYGNANQVVIHGYFANANVDSGIGAGAVEYLQFSDGVNWGWSTINLKVLEATTGNDLLVGYNDRSDTLNGLAGNDSLYGLDGNDILTGGAGNDLLYGGLGNDLYLIAKNDGSDTLDDQGGTSDVVKFTDVASTDITGVSRTYDGSLLVKYGSSQVTIKNYFYTGDSISIEKLLFSNGVVWNAATIALKVAQATAGDDMLFGSDNKDDVLNGYSGNDKLYGFGGNDTLNGGPGNDSMSGGYGNDSYWVDSVGDTISEYADQGTDTV